MLHRLLFVVMSSVYTQFLSLFLPRPLFRTKKAVFSHLRAHSPVLQLCHMNLSSYLLLCLSEGDAEGEGTEVRGVGTGHVRTGSSRMLSFSISSIIYSTDTWKQRGIKKMDDEADKMKAM